MSLFRRYRWFGLAGGITLAFAVVSAAMPRGPLLTAVFDVGYLLLTLAVVVAMAANARCETGASRRFWTLMASGTLLWAFNQSAWVYFEVWRHITFPDPSFVDLFLFLHLVPMIAAVGLRPHRSGTGQSLRVEALDFLLLVVWWVFLYAFIVFPSQYVSLNVAQYDRSFGPLYSVEGAMLVLVLGMAARGAVGGWKQTYLNLMAACALYALGSELLDLATSRGTYYSGSVYDVVLMGAMGWLMATALSVRAWRPEPAPPQGQEKWGARVLRLAMLAMLSLPLLGFWVFRWDHSSASDRTFRLFATLVTMVVMGAFVFMRQYIQDGALIQLLQESRHSFENEQRLQSHLVQRAKLASLGHLVAGAAHEMDPPLTAIMEYSEKLWSSQRLSKEQDALLRKIVNQSQRTRDLIANLLSFAQHSSGEKQLVDLNMLLQRCVQMCELQRHDQRIRIEISIDTVLPKVWGDGHKLFQTFVQIVENALDALEEAGGGVLRVSAVLNDHEVIVQFSDSGPGIKEPHRVFDPFYTTKAIGKGTGLGLSAVYGVVQDHDGQITCQNKPEGGALFVLRLPMTKRVAQQQALAAAQT